MKEIYNLLEYYTEKYPPPGETKHNITLNKNLGLKDLHGNVVKDVRLILTLSLKSGFLPIYLMSGDLDLDVNSLIKEIDVLLKKEGF